MSKSLPLLEALCTLSKEIRLNCKKIAQERNLNSWALSGKLVTAAVSQQHTNISTSASINNTSFLIPLGNEMSDLNEYFFNTPLAQEIFKKYPSVNGKPFELKSYIEGEIRNIYDFNKIVEVSEKEHASSFLNRVYDQHISYFLKADIHGITAPEEGLNFSFPHGNATIRRLAAADLSGFYDHYGLKTERPPLNIPHSIVEIKIDSEDHVLLLTYLEALKIQIMLWKCIEIVIDYIAISSSNLSEIKPPYLPRNSKRIFSNYYCAIEDKESLEKFSSSFSKKIFDFTKSFNPIFLAYRHYHLALCESDYSSVVTNAVIGLEALLLHKEKSEITYKLTIRTAKIFSFLQEKPESFMKLVKTAYKIRSKYSHGEITPDNDINKAEKMGLKNKILESLRTLIIIYLENNLQDKKEAFLKKLDLSLAGENLSLNEIVSCDTM